MQFDETIIWHDDNAPTGQPSTLSHKGPRAGTSRSLRSVTSWTWHDATTFETRHLYLSDHGDEVGGVRILRIRYFENLHDRDRGRTVGRHSLDDVRDPLAAADRVAHGDAELGGLIADTLAERIPDALLQYVPTDGSTGAQLLVAARWPLLRHLAETQHTTLPERIPLRLARLLETRTARDALARLVGPGEVTRPAAAELGRVLVVDGRIRTREMSMLPACRGLPRDLITDIIVGLRPVGDGSAIVEPSDSLPANQVLAELGTTRHRQAIVDLLSRTDGHAALAEIGQAARQGRMSSIGAVNVDQLVERATRRGPMDDLHGATVPGTDSRLQVLYPGDNAELVELGTQMRNCIRMYASGGAIPFRDGAIIAVVDRNGRATHAIQVDADRRVTGWEGRGGSAPPAADRQMVAQILRDHSVTVPDRRAVWRPGAVPF